MTHDPDPAFDSRTFNPQWSDIRILAVFGVVFGTLGISALPFSLGSLMTAGWPVAASTAPHALDRWALASTLLGLGLATLLLLSSLGAYHFTRWGCDGMLLWAGASLAYGALGIFFWGRFFLYAKYDQYADLVGPDQAVNLLAWLIGTGFATFTLWYLTRPAVSTAFRRAYPFTPDPEAPRHATSDRPART